jgi:hypothetical protein
LVTQRCKGIHLLRSQNLEIFPRKFGNICEVVDHCINLTDDYIFRGQRLYRPLRSTLFRLEKEQRKEIWNETLLFCQWIKDNPSLKPFHDNEDLLFAIAQHYYFQFFSFSLATDLIDFTRDVKIAAFFATTSDQIRTGDEGVVYMVSISAFEDYCKDFGETYGTSIPAFFKPELPRVSGCWRLENQEGLFMRDYAGFVSQRPHIWDKIGDALVFKQTEDVTVTNYFPEINKQLIYPTANNFEREILRYEAFRRRSRPIPNWMKRNMVVKWFGPENDFKEFEEWYPSHEDWVTDAGKWSTIDLTLFKNALRFSASPNTKVRLLNPIPHILNILPYNLEDVVKTLRQSITEGATTIPIISPEFGNEILTRLPEKELCKLTDTLQVKFREVLSIMLPTPASAVQIARAMQNLFALAFHDRLKVETYTGPYMEDTSYHVVAIAFQEKGINNIGLEGKSGRLDVFIPSFYLDGIVSMVQMKEIFNQQHSTQIRYASQLLQFFTDTRKLMSLREFVDLWASFVIPFELLFRNADTWIINPYHVLKITRNF